MIVSLAVILLFIGMGMMTMDVFVPIPPQLAMMILMNKLLGMVFYFFGLVLLIVRMMQTGVIPVLDLPSTKRVILFHQRRGRNPNTTILVGKLTDLEFIRSKNKLFKDTGGGFRIAGHDCRRTHETIAHDIPDWLSQYFYDIRQKYGIEDLTEFKTLRKELKALSDVEPLEPQLEKIELLKPIMKKTETKKALLDMDIDDLRDMTELFFDGATHHGEEVEHFIESSTPNELDALEKQTYLNDMMRERNYTDPGEVNWAKWVPILGFLLLTGAIAAIMIKGAFGN